jgi:hypothetical protein
MRRTNAICLCVVATCAAYAQWPVAHTKTFHGPYDSEYPYPAIEGKSGQKDAVALARIEQATKLTSIPDGMGLQMQALLKKGSEKVGQQASAAVTIEHPRLFRMDVEENGGTRSLRIVGENGQVKRATGSVEPLDQLDFGELLTLPSHLFELASRKDAAVTDDGPVTVGDLRLDKMTITLFKSKSGKPISMSLYFDSGTHLLKKSVVTRYSAMNPYLESLKVATYDDYRAVESLMVPYKFSETANGQPMISITVNSASLAARHDESFFKF